MKERRCSDCGSRDIDIQIEKVDFGQSWPFYAPVWKCLDCKFAWTDYLAEELYERISKETQNE